MARFWLPLLLIFVVFSTRYASAAATPPAAISSCSMLKFESGYYVEIVFDGSKMGIEPYSVEVSPSGQLLILGFENSNIFKISAPLSQYSWPELLARSAKGYFGHVDGKLKEAKIESPKRVYCG